MDSVNRFATAPVQPQVTTPLNQYDQDTPHRCCRGPHRPHFLTPRGGWTPVHLYNLPEWVRFLRMPGLHPPLRPGIRLPRPSHFCLRPGSRVPRTRVPSSDPLPPSPPATGYFPVHPLLPAPDYPEQPQVPRILLRGLLQLLTRRAQVPLTIRPPARHLSIPEAGRAQAPPPFFAFSRDKSIRPRRFGDRI